MGSQQEDKDIQSVTGTELWVNDKSKGLEGVLAAAQTAECSPGNTRFRPGPPAAERDGMRNGGGDDLAVLNISEP